MRTWGWVLAVLGWAAMVIGGFFGLLLGYVGPDVSELLVYDWAAGILSVAGHRPEFFAAAGMVLLILASVALVSPISYWRSRRQLVFPGERGLVLVDTSTVEECLRRELAEEPDVVRSRISVRPIRGALLCQLTVWLETGADVIERVRSLQERLQSYYSFILPGGAPLKMESGARLIYRKGGPRRPSGRLPAATSVREGGDIYGGPRFPVDANDSDVSGMTSS